MTIADCGCGSPIAIRSQGGTSAAARQRALRPVDNRQHSRDDVRHGEPVVSTSTASGAIVSGEAARV